MREVARLMESLNGLINEIQQQHSPELRSFATNDFSGRDCKFGIIKNFDWHNIQTSNEIKQKKAFRILYKNNLEIMYTYIFDGMLIHSHAPYAPYVNRK